MSSNYVKRITLFKIPKEEDISALLEQYEILRSTATKNGAPYIVSNEAHRIANHTEERAQGYTLVSITVFKSEEDFVYYDKECAAHAKLRDFATTIRTGFATLRFESNLA
ncbi:hypothetical protein B0A52_08884 [Exophiala mesophila]|uniref:Stress-response A/B barrel domain-containing protein n=1 Tax=Exophiala mesophila TaxID=212818 RepID=A0A438MUV0_EXOME|nr:hypothetical protein B0A52_08884 [Exophiala mesophila]